MFEQNRLVKRLLIAAILLSPPSAAMVGCLVTIPDVVGDTSSSTTSSGPSSLPCLDDTSISQDSLLARWTFDQVGGAGSGSEAMLPDLSPLHLHPGVVKGSPLPSVATGDDVCFGALRLLGDTTTAQHVELKPAGDLALTKSMTILARVRLDLPTVSKLSSNQAIISKSEYSMSRGWRLSASLDGPADAGSSSLVVRFSLRIAVDDEDADGGTCQFLESSVGDYAFTGGWFRVIGVYDADVRRMQVSVNAEPKGELKTSLSLTTVCDGGSTPVDTSSIPGTQWNDPSVSSVTIGYDPHQVILNSDAFFCGAIDEIIVWKRALFESEIKALL